MKRSGKSAMKLAYLLATHFPSYRDVGTYNGKIVTFLKRAQIFPADVWNRFEGKGFGEFTDIDDLTMFADYRLVNHCHLVLTLSHLSPLSSLLSPSLPFSEFHRVSCILAFSTIPMT